MKTFRRKRSLSNVILFSIGEFAWLVVFFMLIISNKLSVDLEEAKSSAEEGWQAADASESRIAKIEKHLINIEDTDKLKDKIAILSQNLKKYDAMQFQLKLSESINRDLELKLDNLKAIRDKEKAIQRESAEKRKSKDREIEHELSKRESEIKRLENENKKLASLKKTLYDNEKLIGERNRELEATLQTLQDKELAIRQEIVGIEEDDLEKVVFIFDRSSSMAKGDGRWEAAQKEVRIWLEYMPIQEIALVDFHTSVNVFPEELGTYLRLRNTDRSVNTSSLKEILRRFSLTDVKGGTNTLLALKTAYQFSDASMIILFTDGKPNVFREKREKADSMIKTITNLVASKRKDNNNIPIYSVAIGIYGEEQVRFLKELAHITDGNFIGK